MKQEIKKRVAGFTQRLFLTAVFVFTALGASGQEVTFNGIVYTLNNEDNTAIVKRGGGLKGAVNIPEVVIYNDIEYTVTTIGKSAFFTSQLTSITIPNTVTTIGNSAFMGSGLTSVTIPNSVTTIQPNAFAQCSSLTNASLSESLITIDASAFNRCRSLTSIYIPNSVELIGMSAFRDCDNLTDVTIGDMKVPVSKSEGTIGTYAFYGCDKLTNVSIGGSIATIESSAFAWIDSLTSVIINGPVNTIGNGAFSNCSNLTSVVLPDSLRTIGWHAFAGCSSLTNIALPDSLKTIDRNAFQNCSGLTDIALPKSLMYIGEYAFLGCSGLTRISIPESVTHIGGNVFEKCSALKEVCYNAEDCESFAYYAFNLLELDKVIIGEKVKRIPQLAFETCTSVKEVYFNAANCTECGSEKLFCFPEKLDRVIIGDNVRTIPSNTFRSCIGLKSITFVNSVDSIGKNAFADCSGLSEVMAPSIESWLKIKFENDKANPTYYAKKLICNGSSIRKLMIPEGEKRINAYAFVNCEPLVTVNVPVGFEGIGTLAFKGCSGQQRFIFESLADFLSINYDDEKSRFTEGNSGKIYIKDQAFDATNIGEMTLPEGMKFIPDYAFYGYGITGITVPADLEWIGKYAFADTKLASIKCEGESERSFALPDKISEVKEGCFRKTQLTKVSFGSTVTAIGANAFSGCDSMEEIEFLGVPVEFGSDAFNYGIGNGRPKVIIPCVKDWAQAQFGNAAANPMYKAEGVWVNDAQLHNMVVNVPEKVMGGNSFAGAKIEKARITADSIGRNVLSESSITALCIDTKAIGENAFAQCASLKAVYSMTAEPPSAPDNAFTAYEGVTLYVPVGARSAYENAETCWWRFLNVVETDFADVDELFKAVPDEDVTGIIDITPDDTIDANAPVRVYNLGGQCIGNTTEGLATGVYIVRQGRNAVKLYIR